MEWIEMDEWLRFSMTSLWMESILSETYLIEYYYFIFDEFRGIFHDS